MWTPWGASAGTTGKEFVRVVPAWSAASAEGFGIGLRSTHAGSVHKGGGSL